MVNDDAEQFEVSVHKCFGKIFELLQEVDEVVKKEAEKEETAGRVGEMCGARDRLEEIFLQCHLAWQYHRLSRVSGRRDTWDEVEAGNNPGPPDEP